jgi:hypothetical protein
MDATGCAGIPTLQGNFVASARRDALQVEPGAA